MIGWTAELSSGRRILDQLTVIHMVELLSGYMSQTDWMNPARLEDQRRTSLLPCFAEETCSVEKDLHQLLEVGGNPTAEVADAVAPWDLIVPVIVASEAVPFLAVAGTDSTAIVEAIQANLSVPPLTGEMRMSPTTLAVDRQCPVEETQSAVKIKMTRMVDDSEAASFECQTD